MSDVVKRTSLVTKLRWSGAIAKMITSELKVGDSAVFAVTRPQTEFARTVELQDIADGIRGYVAKMTGGKVLVKCFSGDSFDPTFTP